MEDEPICYINLGWVSAKSQRRHKLGLVVLLDLESSFTEDSDIRCSPFRYLDASN